MQYEWIFSGIGTELISLVVGVVLGILGEKAYKKYICKVKQKTGDNSNQVISSGNSDNSGNTNLIAGDLIRGDRFTGHKVDGDMKVYNFNDEFDVRRIPNISNSEIEKIIYEGNDATVRKWCLELILKDKQEYLINLFINKMNNNQEKYNLLKGLIERNQISSKYCRLIEESIDNNVNLFKIIELYVGLRNEEYIPSIFRKIDNDEYIFRSLKSIYPSNKALFDSLYNKGNCFSDDKYIKKMQECICKHHDNA